MFKHDTRIFHPWQLIVMGICFAMLFDLVGSYDYEDKKLEDTHYCKMVMEGTWPAFKEIDGVYCK